MRTIPSEPTQADIGWLAGILDGEGSIVFSKRKRHPRIAYGINLVNTNMELMEKANNIIARLCKDLEGTPIKISTKAYATNPFGTTVRKQCYQITIRRQTWIVRILGILLPHLTEKRVKASALHELFLTHIPGQWYTEKELEKAQWARRD